MKPLILIADPVRSRLEELVRVLGEEGHAVAVAEHGVEALERALGDGAQLVIAAHGLPLVDAPRLAEIVRSNPRTRGARFLFLGEPEPGVRFDPGVGDAQIPATLRPEDIAEAARELLARRDRIADFAALTGKGERGSGSLEQLSLADLVQLLHDGRKSGVLEIAHDDPVLGSLEGAIWVCDGEIVDARTGSAEGEKALFRMMGWTRGEFEFGPGDGDEAVHIRVPTAALLTEGLRQIQETTRLASQLPPLDAVLQLRVPAAELPTGVHPLTREVLAELQTHAVVADVVDRCSYPDYQVLRTLLTLCERGLIGLTRPNRPATADPDRGLFSPAQVRRLRDWTRESQGRPRQLRDPRLLVAASDPMAIPDFANLLRPVPGITLSAETERGAIGEDDLAAIGHVRVDDRLALDLVHLPAVPRFAPFWARAAHRSVGVLFLLSGPVGEAVERLAPMVQAVTAQPRARVFHAALLGRGQRPSPDELREHLSLFDDASLFLLPLDPAKGSGALVARMFGRLAP